MANFAEYQHKSMKFITAALTPVAIALGACTGAAHQTAELSASSPAIIVGSYSAPGDSALCVYAQSADGASFSLLGKLPVANASFATFGSDGTVYAVTEDSAGVSAVTALVPDSSLSTGYRRADTRPVGADSPCYVEVSPDGRFILTANYGSGSVAVFPVGQDGAIGPRSRLIEFSGSGPVKGRQDSPHPHSVTFTPDSRYMLVADLGTDCIYQYELTDSVDSPVSREPAAILRFEPGSGPRHMTFDSAGRTAYLINEISDKVTVLRYDGRSLTPVQYIAADTVGAGGAADIHLSPDGRHLYASLRLKHDGIATFSVDPSTGLLTRLGHTSTGSHPRNFAITPDGRRMLVACRDTGSVEIYTIDPATGALTPESEISQPKAVLVKMIPQPENGKSARLNKNS